MLKIQNLTKKFGSLTALNEASFEIGAGEIVALIGPNGSGKTTLVKIVCGLLQPTSGVVLVGSHNIMKNPIDAKKLIGYIPDEPSIWQSMTGEEFLHFTGALYGMPEQERIKIIPDLLSAFKLKDIEKRYFEDYSRGNKQKFAILAALLHKPKLLLIDEPIVGLDPSSADAAKQMFQSFAADGGSVLLVTHTLSVAEEIAHRIGILQKGKLIAMDTFENLKKQANLASSASLGDIYKTFAG